MREFIRRYLPQIVLLLMLALAVVAGSIGIARGVSTTSGAKAQPQVLRYANEGTSDLLTLDPANGTDLNSRQAAQIIFGGLVRFGPNFEVLPDVASHWDVTDGGRLYTFHLRPNVRYGDGSMLEASDIAFSLNRVLSPSFAQRSGSFLLSDIAGAAAVTEGKAPKVAGIQVVNRHTIRIRLVSPTGSFLRKLATPAGYIVPPSLVKHRDWYRHAFGTGPFKVGRWIPNDRLLLVPNPYYWQGKLHIGGIDMPFFPEPVTAYKRYIAGAVDIMGTIHFPPEILYDVQGQPDFHVSPGLRTVYLTLNERRPPFNNTLVRRAFFRALDRRELAQVVYGGFAHPTNVFLPPGLPGYNPSISGIGYSPAAARQLLARAGYPRGKGLPQVTYAVDQDAQQIALASNLAQQWKRTLGVRVKLQLSSTHTDYLTLLDNVAYQIASIDWTADFPDPANFLSQQLRTRVPNNNGDYSNHTFDALVDKADRLTGHRQERNSLYHQAETTAMREAAIIPLVNPDSAILLRNTVRGLHISGGQLLAKNWAEVSAKQNGD